MMGLVVVLVVIIAVVAVLALLKDKESSRDDGYSFTSLEALFSPAERSFLGVLEQALDNRFRVFGKVRLGDLVKPGKGLSKSKRATARNKVQQKHVDFVICSAADLQILGVVELDDQSHDRRERVERDTFVDHALRSATIPIARFSAKKAYPLQEVRSKLFQTLKAPENVSEIESKVVSPVLSMTQTPPTPTPTPSPTSSPSPFQNAAILPVEVESPTCGKCGAAMVKRQAKKGPHAGKFFWACTSFPNCRQVTAIAEA